MSFVEMFTTGLSRCRHQIEQRGKYKAEDEDINLIALCPFFHNFIA
jgi:hypothetical protein